MGLDYKKLYEQNDIILANVDSETLAAEIESVEYMEEYFKQKNRFIPPVDFSDPKQFARFGSAEKYYIDAIDRVYKTYPYDGSLKERIQWELSSSYFDLFIFDHIYPRTNGHVILSAEGWSAQNATTADYGEPVTKEYIFVKGGPRASNRAKAKSVTDTSGDYKSGYANVWKPAKNRECNLKIGGVDGNTVEFWMKKGQFVNTLTGREVVFDAYTSNFISSSANYGRLTIEMTGSTAAAASPFRVTYMSGTSGLFYETIGSSVTTSSVADDKWHHYAFTFKNRESNVEINLYVDGACNGTIITGSSINYVSGNINAAIGALVTYPSGTAETYGDPPTLGWGKLSGSVDEFRFWKTERNTQQIARYMIEPIGGGTNTDDANTELGVYYKFNEGITQTSSTDSNILDYSGRISNGTFVGYNTAARNLGSAMVSSSLVDREFKDPILYNLHPKVAEVRETKKQEGRIHDFANNASIYHTLPAWILEDDEDKELSPLKNLTQIVGSYFDSLAQNISSISQLKHKNYLSSSVKAYPFADRLLQSVGFTYFPELFSDATALEHFKNRNDQKLFKEKLYDVKNRIYQNIYNNIVYIYKTKGTEKSFRNLIHCFGLGDEIYRINTYGHRVKYTLKDNFKSVSEYKKYVNFGLTGTAEATVFPHSSSTNPNSQAIISGTAGLTTYLGLTMESEVHFPIRHSMADSNTVVTTTKGPSRQFRTYANVLTASLFGMDQVALDATGNDLTWASDNYANFAVYAAKSSNYSKKCKFHLAGDGASVIGDLGLTSSWIDDVFDDTRWTFSVSVKPNAIANLASGSSGSVGEFGYTVEFYGVEKIVDVVKNEFYTSGTLSAGSGWTFMNYPKAPFIGARRTNFSGSLVTKSDGNISSTRIWLKHLPTGTIQQHHQDVKNYGTEHPYKSTYLHPTLLAGTKIPEIDTLVLNWEFNTVTGSDSNGQFIGEDFSSGSTNKVSQYGEIGEIIGKQYLPKGFGFPADTTLPINKKYIYSAKKQLPEMINSSDMVNILTDDDLFFNKVDLMRPTNYYTSIEKSMYQTISDEMIKMFSTIKDFNNLIGEPVNKYRDDYKLMSKLRQLFFERIGNTPDLDKYIDFYKWVDITLDTLLGYLIPASADMSDQYGGNIRTMIENTVLQRNKYKWQYPTLEDKTPDLEGTLLGINELIYDWEFGHAPLDSIQSNKCLWWKERALRTDSSLTSGDTNVDSDKQTILNSILNETNASAPTLGSSGSSGISTYQGSTYAIRRLAKSLKLKVDESRTIKGGANFYPNKNLGYFDAINWASPNQSNSNYAYGVIQVANSDLEAFKDCGDNLVLNKGKRKYSFKAKSRLLVPSDIYNIKSLAFPGGGAAHNLHRALISDSNSLSFGADGTAGNEPSFSISAWIYMSDATNFSIFSKAGTTTREYSLETGGSDNLYFRIFDSAHTIYIGVATLGAFGTLTSYENQWVHLCVTYDGSRAYTGIKLYLNGEAITTAQYDNGSYTAMHNTAEDAQFARSYTGATLSTTGFIDESAAFDKELSTAEVLELWHNGFPLNLNSFSAATNLVSWWRMGDKATGTSPNYTIPDQLGSNDIVMSNFNGNSTSGVVTKAVPRLSMVAGDNYKGDKILPFNLLSASLSGGYHDAVNNNFNTNTDIANLHLDIHEYGDEVPIQGPFTEKYVGGKPYRHVFTNFTPNDTSLDTDTNRLEGWVLELNSNTLNLWDADFGRINNPHSNYFRGELAKRPINIRNILQTTGSTSKVGQSLNPANATVIGNYTNDYEVIMTSGRSINNRYFVKNEGITASSIDSQAVSGVLDYDLPGASKSDVDRTQVTKNGLTSLASNNYIIVNRFSAPGDPSTMGLGYLDIEAQEYSVYNALPWRNLIVRQSRNELYTDHAKQFGYFSDTQNSASYALASQTYPGTSGSVNTGSYYIAPGYTDASASFHKVNRNPRKVRRYASATTTSSHVDDVIYDNWFVQHQIPQTDLQYAWITASVANGYTGSALYGFEQPDFSNASLASTDITFCTASDFGSYHWDGTCQRYYGTTNGLLTHEGGSNLIHDNFVGIGPNLIDPITSSENTLGFPLDVFPAPGTTAGGPSYIEKSYANFAFQEGQYSNCPGAQFFVATPGVGVLTPNAAAAAFNGLILRRQGPYGWPSWKQTRGAQHPVMRYNYANNIQTFAKVIATNKDAPYFGFNSTVVSQSEPVITSKFRPLKYRLEHMQDHNPNKSSMITMWTAYGNEKSYFTNIPIVKDSGLIDLNNSSLVYSKAGNTTDTLQQADNKILMYETMNRFLLTNLDVYVAGAANPVKDFIFLEIPEVIYPREHYSYSKRVRQRENFYNDFWRDSRENRSATRANSQNQIVSQSMWPLDPRSGSPFASSPTTASAGLEGELQNGYSLFFLSTNPATEFQVPVAAPTYNRRVPEKLGDGTIIYAGDTQWQTGDQIGVNPSFNTYEDYAEDIKRIGKDYGIIPEFRMSEHMEHYVVDLGEQWYAHTSAPSNFLTLTGSKISSSAETSFYTIYTHSDFMKYFEPIRTDFEKIAIPTKLTLKCKAITKLLPYDGFYPADRIVQVAQLFSQSFGPDAELKGDDANWRTLVAPLFSPGILLNSIKSGISVDYPIVSTAIGSTMDYTGSGPDSSIDDGDPRLSGTFDQRIPFEALADPELYQLVGKKIVDAEPHNSASIDSTGSLTEASNPLYKYAINNFLAEVPEFFLGNPKSLEATDETSDSTLGPLSYLVSKAYIDPDVAAGTNVMEGKASNNIINVIPNTPYRMRIVCSHAKVRDLHTLKDTTLRIGAARAANSPSFTYNVPTITMYNRSFDRSKNIDHGYSLTYIGENEKTLAYGSSFGPPCDASSSIYGATASFEPYTPPYYDGYSHLELKFIDDDGGDMSITDIMKKVTVTSYRETTLSSSLEGGGTTAGNHAMSLSASINWNQIVSTYTEAGVEERLVIQPKWECPILDFNSSNILLPTNGSGSVAKGMWHQSGAIPSINSGVYLEVRNISDAEIKANSDLNGTKSFAELLGFTGPNLKSQVKLGQISKGKKIHEAIVVVPFFFQSDYDDKSFFKIDKKTIRWAEALIDGKSLPPDFLQDDDIIYKPANSVIKMVKAMRRYSLPPHFDFLTDASRQPFAMAFFEFSMQLEPHDLVNIWQNVLPNAARKNAASGVQCAVSEVDFGFNLLSEWETLNKKNQSYNPATYKGWDTLNSRPAEPWGPKFPNNIQWMVFKVKQKAQKNYFNLTAQKAPSSPLVDELGKDIPPYSYNWPYDFCSIIELAKIESTVRLEPHETAGLPNPFEAVTPPTIYDILTKIPDSATSLDIEGVLDTVSDSDMDKARAAIQRAKGMTGPGAGPSTISGPDPMWMTGRISGVDPMWMTGRISGVDPMWKTGLASGPAPMWNPVDPYANPVDPYATGANKKGKDNP